MSVDQSSVHTVGIRRFNTNNRPTYQVMDKTDKNRGLFVTRDYNLSDKQAVNDATFVISSCNWTRLKKVETEIGELRNEIGELSQKLDDILNILMYAPPLDGGEQYKQVKQHFDELKNQ